MVRSRSAGCREFGNPLPDLLADFLAGNDLTVVGRLDATLNGSSGGFVDFDLGFAGDDEIRLGSAILLFEFPAGVEFGNQGAVVF